MRWIICDEVFIAVFLEPYFIKRLHADMWGALFSNFIKGLQLTPEAYLDPRQTPKIERFVKPLTKLILQHAPS